MACFSCSAGWIFSICLVRKSIFRLKNSRASSAVWVDKGQKQRRGAESLQGPHGRQPCLPPTADRRLFWAQPTPPAYRSAAAGRKKAASTPGNCIPLPGLKSRTLRAPSGSSSSGSSSSSSSSLPAPCGTNRRSGSKGNAPHLPSRPAAIRAHSPHLLHVVAGSDIDQHTLNV